MSLSHAAGFPALGVEDWAGRFWTETPLPPRRRGGNRVTRCRTLPARVGWCPSMEVTLLLAERLPRIQSSGCPRRLLRFGRSET